MLATKCSELSDVGSDEPLRGNCSRHSTRHSRRATLFWEGMRSCIRLRKMNPSLYSPLHVLSSSKIHMPSCIMHASSVKIFQISRLRQSFKCATKRLPHSRRPYSFTIFFNCFNTAPSSCHSSASVTKKCSSGSVCALSPQTRHSGRGYKNVLRYALYTSFVSILNNPHISLGGESHLQAADHPCAPSARP